MKNEMKHLQANQEKWDEWAEHLDGGSRRSDFLREAQGRLISILDLERNVQFLDVGCGTGWAVGEAARRVGDQGVFYGIDLSPRMIEKARRNFQGRGNFHFLEANAESIPLENDFFDTIICTNSFHHYLHPERAVQEFSRLLKKGGRVYILDPTADTWVTRLADWVIRRIESEHVKMYSSLEFQQLFENVSLGYIASKPVDSHSKIHIGEK